jgi:catechol 2,3-dioxygenase-like lactoylglutathione lyase family enzyme
MNDFAGFGHVALVVSDFEQCMRFYDRVLGHLGMRPYTRGPLWGGWWAGEHMFTIQHEAPRDDRFSQRRVGLHHLSFRARSRQEVDSFAAMLREIGATIVHPAEEGPFWPGYYSVLSEDPDGTRIEMNYIAEDGWRAVAKAADALRKSES